MKQHSHVIRFELFEKELTALCKKHHVQLASSGYDYISVWEEHAIDNEAVYGGLSNNLDIDYEINKHLVGSKDGV